MYALEKEMTDKKKTEMFDKEDKSIFAGIFQKCDICCFFFLL